MGFSPRTRTAAMHGVASRHGNRTGWRLFSKAVRQDRVPVSLCDTVATTTTPRAESLTFIHKSEGSLSQRDYIPKPGVADAGGYPGCPDTKKATPTALWKGETGPREPLLFHNLSEVASSSCHPPG